MTEKVLPYTCSCGGKLKKSHTTVEFFGIDFGIKECEVCTSCGSEFLDEKVMTEIEETVKKKKLFGLERKVKITKSGNSLVMRIPPAIAEFANIHYENMARVFPLSKKKIEVELL